MRYLLLIQIKPEAAGPAGPDERLLPARARQRLLARPGADRLVQVPSRNVGRPGTLGAEKLAHGVCQLFLEPQDQALAVRDLM